MLSSLPSHSASCASATAACAAARGAGLRTMRSEIVVSPVERDDGLPGGPVPSVGGQVVNEFRHDATLPWFEDCKHGMYRFAFQGNAALPNAGR
jgi:hypothetical protein